MLNADVRRIKFCGVGKWSDGDDDDRQRERRRGDRRVREALPHVRDTRLFSSPLQVLPWYTQKIYPPPPLLAEIVTQSVNVTGRGGEGGDKREADRIDVVLLWP